MFSFLTRKIKKSEPLSPINLYRQEYLDDSKKYEKDSKQIKEYFPTNYPQSKSQMIDFMVQLRLLQNESLLMQEQQRQREKRLEQERLKQSLQNQQLRENRRQKESTTRRNQQTKRNRLINNFRRKHDYKSRKNLVANALRQRSDWRQKNPNANYYSLENFIESPLFQPHNLYTGLND